MHRHTLPRPLPSGSVPNRSALRDYRTVDLDARVAAATPHGLVLLLFERLAMQMKVARMAAEAGDSARRLAAIERGLAIVDGLDTSLDSEGGGQVAAALHSAYGLLRDQLRDGSPAALAAGEASARTLRDAWAAIAADRGSINAADRCSITAADRGSITAAERQLAPERI